MYGRSFRSRLTFFFLIIVILPMVAVSVILFRLVSDSERGKSDARLSQAQTSISGLFRDRERQAAEAGRDIGQSVALAAAIASDDRRRIESELTSLARGDRVSRATLMLANGERFDIGSAPAVAPSTTTLVNSQGGRAGTLVLSVASAQRFAQDVAELSDVQAAVVGAGGTVASTLPDFDATKLPDHGEVHVGGRRYRLAAFSAPAFGEPNQRVKIHLLADQRSTQTAITQDTLIVAGLLVAFLILAFAFALFVSRSLQAQIQRLLDAARRLGGGEFSVKVPTEGDDEFAALGSEFNAMARQLESRLEDLETERSRLQRAIRHVGESFAKGLDRDALLTIVVQTAVDAVAAGAGRASVREAPGGPMAERARVGEHDEFEAVLSAVEAAVIESREAAEVSQGEMHALAHPLRPTDAGRKVLGLISVAREHRAFSDAEKDLFNWLASQASVSIENVDLHETVQRQAVTDELTGLFNHRRFQEVMSIEVERSRRFDQSLGLIMLDIDDFKSVNDRFGHLQGDQVLREVARVLLETSREIDEPARYGGEEMCVALPQTDLDGAYQFAERVRQKIEALEVPRVGGNGGGSLKITASFGAAALPESAAADKDALVAAADSALYRAKRLGKNRVVKAG